MDVDGSAIATSVFYFLNATVLIAMIISGVFWMARLLRRFKSSQPTKALVPLESRSYPTWTLAAFLVMFGSQLVAVVILMNVFRYLGYTPDFGNAESPAGTVSLGLLVANALAGLIAMAVTIIWLSSESKPSTFGLAWNPKDVWVGLKASVWFIPPVMIVSAAASKLIPYEHPVLDKLAENAGPMTFVVLFVGTAVVAPLVEEFMFRVLLQSGLQKFFDGPLVDQDKEPSTSDSMEASEPKSWIGDAYRPPEQQSQQYGDTPIPQAEPVRWQDMFVRQPGRIWMPRSFWSIVLTSVVFAAMHIGQGAAFIPLFFLSLGLGYLYQRTGRITASLVVHVVLNALTMCVEFSRIGAGIPSA